MVLGRCMYDWPNDEDVISCFFVNPYKHGGIVLIDNVIEVYILVKQIKFQLVENHGYLSGWMLMVQKSI